MPRAVARRAHQVVEVERRLAEEVRAALLLEHQQLALDRADCWPSRRCRIGAVSSSACSADVLQHGAAGP